MDHQSPDLAPATPLPGSEVRHPYSDVKALVVPTEQMSRYLEACCDCV